MVEPIPPRFAQRVFGAADPGVTWPIERVDVLGERGGILAWLEYGALRVAQRSMHLAPGFVSRRVIAGLARAARRFDRRHTAAAREFLRTARPELSAEENEAAVLQAWRHLFEVVLMTERLGGEIVSRPLVDHFDFELGDDFAPLLDDPRGAIFIGPHVGHWELAAGVSAALGFQPFYAVGKAPKNRPLSRRLQRLREMQNIRLLPRRGAMKAIPQVLSQGGYVGLLLDQRALLKPVIAQFFGRPASCDRTVGVLLRRAKVPLVFVDCHEGATPGRFAYRVQRVMQPEELASLSPEQIVERVNRELERQILAHPEQYFWLHERYRIPWESREDPAVVAWNTAHAESSAQGPPGPEQLIRKGEASP